MRRVRAVHAHLVAATADQRVFAAGTKVAPSALGPDARVGEVLAPLAIPEDNAAAVQTIVTALETDGCALLPGLISRETCAQLASELSTYVPGTEGTGLTTDNRSHAARRHLQFGGDITEFGANSKAELLLTLFNRDPRWLQLLDPS